VSGHYFTRRPCLTTMSTRCSARTRSIAGALPGMDLPGMDRMEAGDAVSPHDPGQKKAEESATKQLRKGLLRDL
jgi:hypothetical protein